MKGFVFFLKIVLVVLILAFIWGNSLVPGDLSARESELVRLILEPIVARVQVLLARLGRDYTQSFLVRKLAHFSEYAVLGFSMYLLFLRPDGRSRYLVPGGLCLAAAFIDEGIQIFVDSRGPALRDVIIDFCGACTGLFVTAFFVVLIYSVRRRRREYE